MTHYILWWGTHASLASVSQAQKWVHRMIYGSLSHRHSRFTLSKAGIIGLLRQKESPRELGDPSFPAPCLPAGAGLGLCLAAVFALSSKSLSHKQQKEGDPPHAPKRLVLEA